MLILVKVLAQNDNFGFVIETCEFFFLFTTTIDEDDFVRETCEFFVYLQLQQTKTMPSHDIQNL